MKRPHTLEIGVFFLAAALSSTLQLGCGECAGLQCEPITVTPGTYRFVAGQEVSWALEVGDVEIASDRVTVHYIDVDGLDAVATWETSTAP